MTSPFPEAGRVCTGRHTFNLTRSMPFWMQKTKKGYKYCTARVDVASQSAYEWCPEIGDLVHPYEEFDDDSFYE
jgi:hypothetical protein